MLKYRKPLKEIQRHSSFSAFLNPNPLERRLTDQPLLAFG
jgi:hypothetical protein